MKDDTAQPKPDTKHGRHYSGLDKWADLKRAGEELTQGDLSTPRHWRRESL